jgi:rare lipoprotein A
VRELRVLTLLIIAACADVRPPRHPDPTMRDPYRAPQVDATPAPQATSSSQSPHADVERGRASYYADKLAGRKTANGERYDPRQLTAAHRTLAFGTIVEVARSDGRSVRVRINDRGPFAEARVIDLSRRAAEQLGMIRAGVVDVTVRVVEAPSR